MLRDVESIVAYMSYESTLLDNNFEADTIRNRLVRFAQEWRTHVAQELEAHNMRVLSMLITQYNNQVTHLINMFIAQEKLSL